MPALFHVGRAMIEARDYKPEVGGSEGAFIAIIVVLGLVFIGACIGIFVLLRYWDPSEQERTARRRYSIRRRGLPHPLPIGLRETGEGSAGAPASSTLTEKLGNMFRGRRQGSGWQPANEDEEWEVEDEQMLSYRPERASVHSTPAPKQRTVVEPDSVFSHESHASPMHVGTPAADMKYANPFEATISHSPHPQFPEPSITPPPPSAGGAPGPTYIRGTNTRFREDL
ncbi:hypothetical protein PENSPDRAFT_752315 [Peniophora sp. CONT]|nr:hypothetical protein PENSPDRAFT_752315 [Peniophora sp. CONT]